MSRTFPFMTIVCILLQQRCSCYVQNSKSSGKSNKMSKEEKTSLKLKSVEMFDHAFESYKKYAHPADELMPLSCKGRNRGSERDRGDIDEALGNFSLTLIDTLDTLVVLGKIDEFETQVKFVIKNVSFNADVVVSVFETNIRVLGGLLGAHSVAVALKKDNKGMLWYTDELLLKATDIADRLLAAFNTTTGIPYPKVNLRHGVNTPKSRVGHETDTCTACAGTMIMEFGALSRMTGKPIYEQKAHKAMESLWMYRSHHTDLVGTTINIHNGNWIRRDSGIGAGIDSYYEYCLKAYILFGDEWYLEKFNKHYAAIEKYVKKGFMLVDVLMNEPERRIRSHMDALQAFWPGLQVLKGDLQSAIETHEMLYTVAKKFKFLPEAFTTDFNLHWAQHPLRPEFVESTYFLFQATKDPYYLTVGKHIIQSLEKYARVPCGFAALKDLRTLSHENKMDSFVLAETFKYLYLLFSEESEHAININDFIFTTEAHLLPLYLSTVVSEDSNKTQHTKVEDKLDGVSIYIQEESASCPNTKSSITDMLTYAERIRENVKSQLPAAQESPVCKNSIPPPPKVMNEKETEEVLKVIKLSTNRERRLKAIDFVFENKEHLLILKDFGISLNKGNDGKVQLMHQAALAVSTADAEEGLLFMQEMIQLSKLRGNMIDSNPRVVQLLSPPFHGKVSLTAGSAQFGADLSNRIGLAAEVIESIPFRACQVMENKQEAVNRIVVIERGECMFIDKVRLAQSCGAVGAIIVDHVSETSAQTSQAFAMSGDSNPGDVTIPSVFLFKHEGDLLRKHIKDTPVLNVRIAAKAVYENVEQESKEISEAETANLLKEIPKDDDERIMKIHKVVPGEPIPDEFRNEILYGEAERQEVNINDKGKKIITTHWSYISVDKKQKHFRKKVETCPTAECNENVEVLYVVGEQDIKDKGDKKLQIDMNKQDSSVEKPLNIETSNGESFIDQVTSEKLKNKLDTVSVDKDGKVCTSTGCYGSLQELHNRNRDLINDLRTIQQKLKSTVEQALSNGLDEGNDFDIKSFQSLIQQANDLGLVNEKNIIKEIQEDLGTPESPEEKSNTGTKNVPSAQLPLINNENSINNENTPPESSNQLSSSQRQNENENENKLNGQSSKQFVSEDDNTRTKRQEL